MSNGRRGADAERRCVVELKSAGYSALRSAASKGPYDVVAISSSEVLLIQLKRTKKFSKVSYKKEIDAMVALPIPPGGVVKKQLWCWVDREGWRKFDLDVDLKA